MSRDACRLTVYVVEDSDILTKLLVNMLQTDLGVRVVGHSGDATTAVGDIGALQPDVVIIDLVLRSGNGFEVLDAVRTASPATTPIILTNHSTRAYRDAARKLGVDDQHYFDKTEQIGAMCGLVRRMAAERGTTS